MFQEFLLTVNLVDAVRLRQLRAVAIDSRLDDLAVLQDGVVRRVAEMLELEVGQEASRVLSAGGTSVARAYRLYMEGLGYLGRYFAEYPAFRAASTPLQRCRHRRRRPPAASARLQSVVVTPWPLR